MNPDPHTLSEDELAVAEELAADLRSAFSVLAPFRHRAKIAIFGSARLREDTVAYNQVEDLAAMLAGSGFVTVTGGGPGIMTAGLRGAGPGNAVGVAIHLPFEQPLEQVGIPVVLQQRFPTRKLTMMRRLRGVVVAAGGFGTLDELFEILTLIQTAHKDVCPIVLLDDGTGVFDGVMDMVEVMKKNGLISADDDRLLALVHTPQAAFDHICQFFRRYRGMSTTSDGHLLELAEPITERELHELTALGYRIEAHPEGVWVSGRIEAGTLRGLIDEINARATAQRSATLGFDLSVTS